MRPCERRGGASSCESAAVDIETKDLEYAQFILYQEAAYVSWLCISITQLSGPTAEPAYRAACNC
eukprot:6190087-Pleurochrysis_carterae.AAC.3